MCRETVTAFAKTILISERSSYLEQKDLLLRASYINACISRAVSCLNDTFKEAESVKANRRKTVEKAGGKQLWLLVRAVFVKPGGGVKRRFSVRTQGEDGGA